MFGYEGVDKNSKMIDLINSLEDAKKLEKLILQYGRIHTGTELPYINIEKVYSKLHDKGNQGSRLIAAFVDLKVNFTSLLIDSFISGAKWNEQVKIKIGNDESLLDNSKLFLLKLEVHMNEANYIPRYRAMWDKIMGILLLLQSEDLYEKYNSSKSRKKAFKKLSINSTLYDSEFVEYVQSHIQYFDDNLRTGEIHRFGSLRKYFSLKNPHNEEPYLKLRSSWNYMIEILSQLDKIIDGIK